MKSTDCPHHAPLQNITKVLASLKSKTPLLFLTEKCSCKILSTPSSSISSDYACCCVLLIFVQGILMAPGIVPRASQSGVLELITIVLLSFK